MDHVQYIPDKDEVLLERQDLMKELEPGLIYEPVKKEGSESVVDYVVSEGRKCVLKVSKMPAGMRKERAAFLDLRGFTDIPELIKDYVHQDVAIALLVERYNGIDFREFLKLHPDMALSFFQNLRKAIDGFHRRGFAMPGDWLMHGNLLAAPDATLSFVDLGAVEKPSANLNYYFLCSSDNRSFRSVVGEFLDTCGFWRRGIRRKVEGFWLDDKTRNP